MNAPQQAGSLDRVFNSTISLPQQLIWRIWRALEDEDIDLFSERGLLDAALIPGFGVLDSHEHDVMPDYMAAQFGGEGLGPELATAILTDPLTYLTGGMTAAGKVGKAVTQAGRTGAMGDVLRAAATGADQSVDDLLRSTDMTKFREYTDAAVETLRSGPQTREAQKQLKLLGRVRRDIDTNLARAADDLGPAPTVFDAMQMTRKRQIAIGLPGLATFGAKFNVAPGYESWWRLYRDEMQKGRGRIAKSLMTSSLVESNPWVKRALKNSTAPLRNLSAGWRVGGEALVKFTHNARKMADDELQKLGHWTNSEKGAADILPEILKLDGAQKRGAKAFLTAEYRKAVASGLSHEEAFQRALRLGGVGRKNESGAALWGRLSGRGADSTFFPRWGNPSQGVRAIEDTLDKALVNWQGASELAAKGEFNIHPADTDLGRLSKIFKREREDQGDAFRVLNESAFNAGAAMKKAVNKVFRTGEDSTFGEKVYADFLAQTARDNDQLETMGHAFYERVNKLVEAEGHSLKFEDVSGLFGKMMQLEALPGELAATFQLAKINPSNAAASSRALKNYMLRHRRVMSTFETMLEKGGISDPTVREKLIDAFSDDVFPYMERQKRTKEGGAKLRGVFTKVNKGESNVEEVLTPVDKERMRRVNNKHVVLGGEVPAPVRIDKKTKQPKPADPDIQVLEQYRGMPAGYLADADLDAAVGELTSHGQRSLTDHEVLAYAEELPAFRQFVRRHGLSSDEALHLIRTRSKGQYRRVKRTVDEPIPLWDEGRTGWTGAQAEAALQQWGLRLETADDGTLTLASSALTPDSLRRRHGWKAKEMGGHRTLAEAMGAARRWIASQEKYAAKHGPGLQPVRRDLEISAVELDELKEMLSADDLVTLRGRATTFDIAALPQQLHADYERLTKLRARRQLPPEHRLHEPGPIVPEVRRTPTKVADPRHDEDLNIFFEHEGQLRTEAELGEWAPHYARGRVLIRELQVALKKARKQGVAFEPDPRLLAEIDEHAQAAGRIINDRVLDALPPGFADLWQDVKKIQAQQFDAARAAGVWIPGSPVAYLPRYFNKNQRAKIASIIGDIEQEDGSLLVRLGVKQSQRFGRTMDSYSLDDLNAIHAELRAVMANEGADSRWSTYVARIEHEMSVAGIKVQGVPGERLPYTASRLEDDPFLGLLQRMGAGNQDKGLEQYWENILEAADTAPGESLLLGGKVVGIVDNTGKTRKLTAGKQYPMRSTLRSEKEGIEAIDLTEQAGKLEFTPSAIVLETKHGRHMIPMAMLDETGFGLLGLGKAGDEASLGYKPTVGKSFAKASLRSDLHESIFEAPPSAAELADLMDQHVVFGAKNLMASSIKTAAKVHEVVPSALRTFDSINYGIKAFQTIFRLPFHIANLSSGVFQTMMAGASPKATMAAYMDTMRLMAGDEDRLAKSLGMLGDMLGLEETASLGVRRLVTGGRAQLQQVVRLHGNGELVNHLDELEDAGVDRIEDLFIKHADGSETSIAELVAVAAEMGLYGTFSSSLVRGSRTVDETLLRTKLLAMNGDLGGRIKGMPRRAFERMRNLSETSEVFNRTATVLALVREGHPMRRAVEIAKEAHVPYEKLTPFEKNWLKRTSVYYAFPRHYMPWAWARFAEDPKKLSALSHTIRDQNVIASQEGRTTMVLGDMRLDLGRLNANMEAAGMLAAFADRVALPAAEMLPGVSGTDPRDLVRAQSDAGLTSVGGVASLLGWKNLLPQGERTGGPSPDFWGDSVRMVWPIKIAAQVAGKVPSKEEQSPYVDYTPLESWLTDSNFGLGLRKVRPEHELQQALIAYRREARRLQLRAAAAEDPATRDRLLGHVRTLSESLAQIHADTQQKP